MGEKTILLVDDSASLRQILSDLLIDAGYKVITAVNGADGLAKSQGQSINLVLTDINMPIMGGIEFVTAFSAQPEFAQTPVIMLTTEADRMLKTAAKEAGAIGWIIKPYNNQQILNAIKKLAT